MRNKIKRVCICLSVLLVLIISLVRIYEPQELTADKLQSRHGRIIVERYEVTAQSSTKGITTNTDSPHTVSLDNAEPGKKSTMYLVYNPFSSAIDDVIFRINI